MAAIEADYVVIGTGAVGMAFADTILDETNADILFIDRHHMPGGHWNDAYPFVRLHAPSSFYGVASRMLGTGVKDQTGLNKGLYELASGQEVSAYFDQVMRERFLPTGRVQYFPMCEYDWKGGFSSLLSGEARTVRWRRKLVDATYFGTSVPSTHRRKFAVADDVVCIAPNDLPRLAPEYENYVILGAGKTAMDAGVWLMEAGADPAAVTWIVPRDSWLINRETVQPGEEFFDQSIGAVAAQFEACIAATSVDDLFDRMEAAGNLLRIDPEIRPLMYHCATMSRGEVDQLRRIGNVVRKGRVQTITAQEITLDDGVVPAPESALFIDCTATAVEQRPPRPSFEGDRITLQMIRVCQPAFSAAMVAHIETTVDDEAEKNRICKPTPLPDTPRDWLSATIANMTNQYNWTRDQALRRWITECRLDGFARLVRDADKTDAGKQAIITRMREAAFPAVANLQKLLSETA